MVTLSFAEKKDSIVRAWMDEAWASAGPAATGAVKGPGRLASAEGRTMSEALPVIFDEIVGGMDPVRLAAALDDIVRLRAVQRISPSRALGFIPALRRILRSSIGSEPAARGALERIDDRIDSLALQAFDSLVACREQIARARADELRRSHYVPGRLRPSFLEEPGDVP